MADSLKAKAVEGVGWSLGGSIASYGITFLVGIVLARLLTPEDYGLIGIIAIFIAVSNSLVDSGFSQALIRKNDASDEDYNTAFITNLAVSILMALILIVCAPFISDFFNRPELTSLTRVMSLLVVINAFALIQNTVIVKSLNFKIQTKCSIISSLLSGGVGIGMAYTNFGVWSLVGQQISKQTFNTIFLWLYNRWIPSLCCSMKSLKELWGFGWKLLASTLLNSVWNEIYQVVIGKCYTPYTLGQYTRAKEYANLFSNNLQEVIQKVSYPVLSKIQDNKVELKMAYKKIIKVSMFLTCILLSGLIGIAKPLIIVLIGEKWLPCVIFLQLICINRMLYPLHSLNLNMLKVQGRSDLFLKLEIYKKIISIAPILLGIFVSIYWMLIGSIFTGCIAYYLNAYYSGPFLNYSIKEQVRDIVPSFSTGLLMAVLLYLITLLGWNPWLTLSIQLVLGCIYVVSIGELFHLSEYKEIKQISIQFLRRTK